MSNIETSCSAAAQPDPSQCGNLTREQEIDSLLEQYPTSVSRKKRRDLLEFSHTSFHSFRVGVIISDCCKRLDLQLASSTYIKAKAQGVYPSANVFCNFLNLAAGFGDQGSGSGARRTEEPPSDAEMAFIVFTDMKEQGVSIGESTFSAMIRCSCASNRVEQALQLYEDMKTKSIPPKLRTFTHLLQSLSARRDTIKCLAVFDDMVCTHRIVPSERVFLSMFRLLLHAIKADDIRARFFSILHMYMTDVPLPTCMDVLEVIKQWFTTIEQPPYCTTTASTVRDGTLSAPPEQLRSLDLLTEQREMLIQQLDTIAITRDETHKIKLNNKIRDDKLRRAFANPPIAITKDTVGIVPQPNTLVEQSKHCDNDEPASKRVKNAKSIYWSAGNDRIGEEAARIARWDEYKLWLDQRMQHRCSKCKANCSCDIFQVVVDGANVGYFKQNFVGAPSHVDYQQIDQLIQFLSEQRDLKPLIILHSRHLSKHTIPDEAAQAVIDRWKAEDLVYATPKGFNDDWFWIYAAVKYQCKVITNDEMRDHHFQMLSPEWFPKWRERNRIQFTFGSWHQTTSSFACAEQGQTKDQLVNELSASMSSMPSEIAPTDAEYTMMSQMRKNDGNDASQHHEQIQNDISPIIAEAVNHQERRLHRKVRLRFPRSFSYCSQHIVSNLYEGYYFPIFQAIHCNESLGESKGDTKLTSVWNGEVTQALFDQMTNGQWLCCYRELKPESHDP